MEGHDAKELLEGDYGVFEGEWKDDKMHGRFSVKGSDYRYEGEFRNNKMNGEGIWKHNWSDETYEGEWWNNTRHGRGVLVSRNGEIYEGQFLHGSKEDEF